MKINQIVTEKGVKNLKRYRYNVGSKTKGFIYFICEKDGDIIYIGSTVNMNDRMSSHASREEFKGKSIHYFSVSSSEMLSIESNFIFTIKPKYNKCFINSPLRKYSYGDKSTPVEKANETRREIFSLMNTRGMNIPALARIVKIRPASLRNILSNGGSIHQKTKERLDIIKSLLSNSDIFSFTLPIDYATFPPHEDKH